jgi:homoaconitase/3-isopropylmalate dehydratase large subunit
VKRFGTELSADADAVYDEVPEKNLSELVPLAACPTPLTTLRALLK